MGFHSSSRQSMVPYQVPHTHYSYFRWSLNSSLITSTYCCEVIPQGMTTRSMFMELQVIVAFIFGVRSLLNASKPSIPHFFRNNPGLQFLYTKNQSFRSSLVLQTLGWHLTIIPPGSCSLGSVLRIESWSLLAVSGKAKFIPKEKSHSSASYAHTNLCWPSMLHDAV